MILPQQAQRRQTTYTWWANPISDLISKHCELTRATWDKHRRELQNPQVGTTRGRR